MGGNTSLFRVVGAPLTPLPYEANSRTIDPSYFSTLQARLKAGRYFDEGDNANTPKVVIINDTLAKMAFGAQSPVGKQILFTYSPQEKPRQVVGVVSMFTKANSTPLTSPLSTHPLHKAPTAFSQW